MSKKDSWHWALSCLIFLIYYAGLPHIWYVFEHKIRHSYVDSVNPLSSKPRFRHVSHLRLGVEHFYDFKSVLEYCIINYLCFNLQNAEIKKNRVISFCVGYYVCKQPKYFIWVFSANSLIACSLSYIRNYLILLLQDRYIAKSRIHCI